MHFKSRAIDVLKALSKEELKELGKFLESPFHNSNKRLVSLLESLLPYHPEFNRKEFTQENIYKKTFGNSKFNSKIFRNLLTEFYKCEKEYLIIKCLNKNQNDKNIYLIKELRDKMIPNIFEHELEKLKTGVNKNDTISINDFNYKKELEFFESRRLFILGEQSKTTPICENAAEYSLMHFIEEFNDLYTTIVSNEISYKINPQSNLLSAFIDGFDFSRFFNTLNNSEENAYIFLRMKNLEISKRRFDNSGEELDLITNVFIDNIRQFDKSLQYEIGKDILNLYYAELVKGRLEILPSTLKIIKFANEHGILFIRDYGWIGFNNYQSVHRIIILNKDYEFSLKFIEKYKELLHPDIREDALNFALAQHHFSMHEYDKSIELLLKVKGTEPLIKYTHKIILLYCYYEKNFFEQVFYTADSFRKYLTRNKNVSDIHQSHNLNFIHYIEKLARLKEKKINNIESDEAELKTLKEQILSEERVNSRKYLLEKVNELLQ